MHMHRADYKNIYKKFNICNTTQNFKYKHCLVVYRLAIVCCQKLEQENLFLKYI